MRSHAHMCVDMFDESLPETTIQKFIKYFNQCLCRKVLPKSLSRSSATSARNFCPLPNPYTPAPPPEALIFGAGAGEPELIHGTCNVAHGWGTSLKEEAGKEIRKKGADQNWKNALRKSPKASHPAKFLHQACIHKGVYNCLYSFSSLFPTVAPAVRISDTRIA
eukprot:1138875-Pelagomonas_calceolata.AAC.7